MRFRVTANIVWDLEIEGDHKEAAQAANIDLLNALGHIYPTVRHSLRLERLRDRRCPVKLGEFTPADVLPFIVKDEGRKDYQVGDKTYSVRMNSHRYFIFRESLKCAACGLEGSKMNLEQNPSDKSPHFNLYSVENGRLVLMTKDHVQPKAYGGEDRHSNYQTMCAICNNLKGAANLTLDGIRQIRLVYNENRGKLSRRKLRELLDDTRKQLAKAPVEHHVNNRLRKSHLALAKLKEKTLVATLDINVWRLEDGSLVGRSVYEEILPDSLQIACIKKGIELEPISSEKSRILVRFAETDTFWVYQGYVDYLENHEEVNHEEVI